ncbi:Protein CBG20756 [Caenorhabditis briggsae]|uniref:Protein CBG20756 n=1 Tax=Caenorhabditis briggsae TaxID=6238 RepID=A8XYJ3_CAEBR|nr:Protein CBG20756 [Caenorhabditis briggsae]CAP37710.2 Protein CBG20756 [Caenorhabditis briggsae]
MIFFNRLSLILFYSFWFLVGILALRKSQNALSAVQYVKANSDSVSLSFIESSPEFEKLLDILEEKYPRPPAFFLLNQFALNMTDNFLCNTATLQGAHERFVFVTLDEVARDTIRRRWPEIQIFHWPTPSLYVTVVVVVGHSSIFFRTRIIVANFQKPFSFAEGAYQTIYLLRSNLALALIKKRISFWMMQQDTFWRKSIFDLNFEDDMSYDAIFDQLGDGDNSLRKEWVNGANWFIRANNDTQFFFERLSAKLAHWYTPDVGIMIHQCNTWDKPKCAYIPYNVTYSWEWMFSDQSNPPYLLQLDCETNGGTKLMQLGRYGFHFVNPDGTCNNQKITSAKSRMENGTVEVQMTKTLPSWGRLQFKLYWYITEYLLWIPVFGEYLRPYLALAGFILMITI